MYDNYSKVFIAAGHYPAHDGYSNEHLLFSEHEEAMSVVYRMIELGPQHRFTNVPEGDLESKVSFINKNAVKDKDIAIEIHFNASGGNTDAYGMETLVFPTSRNSIRLGKNLLVGMSKYLPFYNRGIKSRRDLYFLKQTIIPAVIVEVLFLDNDTEASYLKHQYAHHIIAQSINYGIAEFIGSYIEKL